MSDVTNATIVENLEVLLAAVEAQPETEFDLSQFRTDTACGSNFCTVGLACTMPRFQALGFQLEAIPRDWDRDSFSYIAKVNGVPVYGGYSVELGWEPPVSADSTFGPLAWQRLFEGAGNGDFDTTLGYLFNWNTDTANMTDKELAIARLKKQIELLKA